MSLRDFAMSPSVNPTALHNAPSGNGSGLQSFHTTQPEDLQPSTTPKVVGAIAVALMIGTAGAAFYMSSSRAPKPVAAVSKLQAPQPAAAPSSAAPAAPAAAAPDPSASMPAASTEMTPAPVPAMKTADDSKKHVKKHVAASASNDSAASDTGSASSARMAADAGHVNDQPQQQVTAPNPASPASSPSDAATSDTAQSTRAQPQADNSAPTQNQQPAPAQPPAQSAGQVNQ